MSTPLRRLFSWIVTLLVPVALVLTAVRAMFTPAFLQFEYNSPGFPPDPFGFTTEERLHWAQYAVDYLVNNEDTSYLADLTFEDGTPLYNQRELRHMEDVLVVTQAAFTVWYVSLALLVVLGLAAWRLAELEAFRQGLVRGGWLTVILLGSIVLFVLVSFGVLFVAFHNIFFQAGTWMFEYSDTLIRLFPERFWRDIFILVGALSLGGGLALALGLSKPFKTAG